MIIHRVEYNVCSICEDILMKHCLLVSAQFSSQLLLAIYYIYYFLYFFYRTKRGINVEVLTKQKYAVYFQDKYTINGVLRMSRYTHFNRTG